MLLSVWCTFSQKLIIDEKKYYLFGRNPDLCDFTIDHQSCSRVHAALVYHKHLKRVFLIDLNSSKWIINGAEYAQRWVGESSTQGAQPDFVFGPVSLCSVYVKKVEANFPTSSNVTPVGFRSSLTTSSERWWYLRRHPHPIEQSQGPAVFSMMSLQCLRAPKHLECEAAGNYGYFALFPRNKCRFITAQLPVTFWVE